MTPWWRRSGTGGKQMGLLIEQQLVALSEAIKHKSFEMDAERIRSLLIEAANTIFNLRRGNGTFPNPGHREKIVNFPKSLSR
jgi:hypothetical protein